MDVPFASSGAFRAQYSLVRNVETSPSLEIADSYLLKEVNNIAHRLRHPSISLKEIKECLILLLYCSVSVASTVLPSLDFALPHAVNLAEAGQRVRDKRIGYLFCAEIMSLDHELRLMLVNTLRKDLESTSEALICLALDSLIAAPSQDVIPAVQTRLQDLLSNNSPHVRRRALLATSALSRHEPDILRRIKSKVYKRIQDSNAAVAGIALVVCLELIKIHEPATRGVQEAVNTLLGTLWPLTEQSSRGVLLQALRVLRVVGLPKAQVERVLQIIRSTSESSDHPLMFSAFLVLADVEAQDVVAAEAALSFSTASCLRQLINSQSSNDHYIFLSCLSCLHPMLWAGTADLPAVLDEWEVGRVMKLLDSSDSIIRRKTLHILSNVDPNVINSYYLQSLRTLPVDLHLNGFSEYATRLLEVVETQTQDDGELYARHVVDLFAQIEARSPRYAECVMESVVELVLVHLRNAATIFQMGCVSTLVATLGDLDMFLGQTMMVIVTALATEYSGKLAVPPVDVLRGLSTRLGLCSVAVQDACLLAMLRISVDCEQVPPDVLRSVSDLRKGSKHHIQQFTSLSTQKDTLAQIVNSASSASLPDFLDALGRHKSAEPDIILEPSSPSTSRASLSSKLRYTAYEAPPPTSRLRGRAPSDRSSSRASSQLSGSSAVEVPDMLSRTVTAGDLALATAAERLEISGTPAALDLIAFNDSPFISDPSHNVDATEDFESAWNALNESQSARGWCDASIEHVIQRLESMDSEVVKVISGDEADEVKILMNGGLLRLRASEEGGCLWRLRSGNGDLKLLIRSAGAVTVLEVTAPSNFLSDLAPASFIRPTFMVLYPQCLAQQISTILPVVALVSALLDTDRPP
ncbi:armadillo-type protein [Mycena amicta]|nr:armadillo-type protein [Mycena amicta]